MTTTIALALLLVSIICVYFINKYRILKNKVNDFNKPLFLRQGYYNRHYTQTKIDNSEATDYEAVIFINELDKYTNGESKIIIDRIEIVPEKDHNFNYDNSKKFILNNFKSIIKTTDVVWLESDQTIKNIHKNKLEQLNRIMKKL